MPITDVRFTSVVVEVLVEEPPPAAGIAPPPPAEAPVGATVAVEIPPRRSGLRCGPQGLTGR